MTEMKHTPTPWETSSNHQNQWDICAQNGGDMIADLAHCDNGEANANFIVRAVNAFEVMQKALLEVQEDYRELLRAGPQKDESDEINEMLEIVDNALAVSRGE